MNMTTKATMGATIVLLVVALFLSLRNHSELKSARAKNKELKTGGVGSGPSSLASQFDQRLKAIESSTRAKDAEIADLQRKLQEEQATTTNVAKESAVLSTHIANVQKEKERELNALQKKIKAAAAIGEVQEVQEKWGFVTVNAGTEQGVEKGLQFAIRRDYYVIGRIKIDTPEANRSVANIVPNSIMPGFNIEPGDSVIAYPIYRASGLPIRDFSCLRRGRGA